MTKANSRTPEVAEIYALFHIPKSSTVNNDSSARGRYIETTLTLAMLKIAIIVVLCISGLVAIGLGVLAEKLYRHRKHSGESDEP